MFLSSAQIVSNLIWDKGAFAVFEIVCTNPLDARLVNGHWLFDIEVLAGKCCRPDSTSGQIVIARFSECRVDKLWITGLDFDKNPEGAIEYHFSINSKFYIPVEEL